jgi:hypothetical protein
VEREHLRIGNASDKPPWQHYPGSILAGRQARQQGGPANRGSGVRQGLVHRGCLPSRSTWRSSASAGPAGSRPVSRRGRSRCRDRRTQGTAGNFIPWGDWVWGGQHRAGNPLFIGVPPVCALHPPVFPGASPVFPRWSDDSAAPWDFPWFPTSAPGKHAFPGDPQVVSPPGSTGE